ncbi:MAG: DUF1080 domain-containing protein [Fibrobacteria bacterium]|nr:DUF1080 domain-containing protein [Fibrobacteria bacterium]
MRSSKFATFSMALFVFLTLCFTNVNAADMADSGWVNIWKGSFDGFKVYFRNEGYISDPTKQSIFVPEGDSIHVHSGKNGLLVYDSSLSYYHVRVDYRWGNVIGTANAGLMPHTDLNFSAITSDNRPRSVECNMRTDEPGSIWLSYKLGPYGATYVDPNDGKQHLPKHLGGEYKEFDPWLGDGRWWKAHYPGGQKPTNPVGVWDIYEAHVYGSDSIVIAINGVIINRVYDTRIPNGRTPGAKLTEGGIAVQCEDFEIYYRDWHIRSLMGCMDSNYVEFGDWYIKDTEPSSCVTHDSLIGCMDEAYVEYKPSHTQDTSPTSCKTPLSIEYPQFPESVAQFTANDMLKVNQGGTHKLEVRDANGTVVFSEQKSGNTVYDFSNIGKAGVYFFQLYVSGNVYRNKHMLDF